MSINPILAQDATSKNELFPLPKPYEMYILKRDGVSFEASNSERKLKGDGKIFLTNQRIVFLKSGKPEKHKVFTSVELPLDVLSGGTRNEPPTFHQPIFGANYLEGNVEPTPNATTPLNATTHWYLYFNKGGCATFLRAFYRLRQQAIESGRSMGGAGAPATPAQMSQQAAFYDPTDPSILYLTQPVPTPAPGITPSQPMNTTPPSPTPQNQGQGPPNMMYYPPQSPQAPYGNYYANYPTPSGAPAPPYPPPQNLPFPPNSYPNMSGSPYGSPPPGYVTAPQYAPYYPPPNSPPPPGQR